MKIDRLLSITMMLINRPMITAKELSEKFEVSIRTIYRDIDSISAAGIPVTSYQGKKGGFCLIDNYRIDRQLLSLNDMVSIVTALKGVNTSFDNNDISDTIEKIESLVPSDKREQVQARYDQIIIDLSHWEQSSVNKNKLQSIHDSISSCRIISFDYRNLRGEDTKRNIEPMTLVLKGNCWYVYGFCRNRNDFRIFRLSRMRNLKTLDEMFILRKSPFKEEDFFNTDKRKPVELKLRFRPSAINRVEEFFSDFPITTDENGFVTVDVSFPEDEWVYSTLLSYGEDCEVLSPPHIREIIKNRLQKAFSYYKT